MIEGIKGAIFDLDGTLIDSMGVWEKVDRDFLEKRNIEIPEDLSKAIRHMTFRDAALYFKDRFQLPEDIDSIMREWDAMVYYEYAHNIALKPGAREYITCLKERGIKVGLATSSRSSLLEAVLKNNGVLYYFDAIATIDEVKGIRGSRIFYLAAQKLGLKPDECVVFEDILVAVLSAKEAGMKVVGVFDECSRHEMEEIKYHADMYIKDFSQLNTRCFA